MLPAVQVKLPATDSRYWAVVAGIVGVLILIGIVLLMTPWLAGGAP